MLSLTRNLLLILFCVSCLLFIAVPAQKNLTEKNINNKFNKFNSVLLFVLVVLLIIAAVFRPSTMADYGSYVRLFDGRDQIDRIEPAFKLLVSVINLINGDFYLLFLIFALISIPLRIFLLNKYSPLVWGSVIVYLSNIYILHDLIQIRAAVASALLILLVYYSYKRNLKSFIITLIISFCFHYSSIVFVVVWFLSDKKNPSRYYILLLFSYLMYFAQYSFSYLIPFIPISTISDLLTTYSARDSYENNAFNLIQLGRIVLAFLFFHSINNEQDNYPWFVYFLKTYIIGLCFLPLFSSLSGVALRLMELLVSCEAIVLPIGFLITFKKPMIYKFAVLVYSIFMFIIYFNAANYWHYDWIMY